MNEKVLFEGIQQGNKHYYEIVFREYYPRLCRFAYTFLSDKDAAEDVVQEVFVTIWQKRESLTISLSLKSYLFQAVKNACFNSIKHEKVKLKSQSQLLANSVVSEENDTMVALELGIKIQEALTKLPPERKKIFLMKKNEGLKYREIADKLNISVKTVENQMGKALKFLRSELIDFLPFHLLIINEVINLMQW